ncbi:MAG: MFS transporter [Acidimicrobiales bacterium]
MTSTAPAPIVALGYRDYRIFWLASIVSNVGSLASLTALGWVVKETTDSAWRVTLVAVAGLLPLAVAGPIGGGLADRMRRRDLLAMSLALQAVFAVLVAVVVWRLDDPYWLLFALSLLGGFVASLGSPVQQAIVTELVPPQHLRNAISLNSSQWNTSRAIGPLLAGALIAAVGAVWVFWINAISFLVMVGALFLIPARPVASGTGESFVQIIRSGMRYAFRSPGIRACLLAGGIVGLLLAPLTWLIAVIATDGFDTGEGEFGVLASSFGFGALIGAVVLVFIEQHFPHRQVVITALFVMSAFVTLLGMVPALWMGVVVLFLTGVAFTPAVSTVVAAMQAHAEDAYRGRVMSLWLMWFGMVSPVAVIVQGVVAEVASIEIALMATGVIAAAVTLVFVLGGGHRAIDPPAPVIAH